MAITTYAELKTAVGNWLARSDLTSRIPEFIALTEDRIANNLRVRPMEATANLVIGSNTEVTAANLGGTANAITITNSPVKTSNALGATYTFTAEATNTSTATVAVDSIGAVNLRKGDGSVALEAGDIVSGHEYRIYFDGTQFVIVPRGGVPLPSRYVAMRRIYIGGDPVRQLKILTPVNFWSLYAANGNSKPKAFTIEGDNIVFGPPPDSDYTGKILYYRRFATLSGDSDTNWVLTNARGLYLYGALLEAYTYIKNTSEMTRFAALWDQAKKDIEERDKMDRYSGDAPVVQSDLTTY